MTDDAELRARIEAQVAARRAGGSSSTSERGGSDGDGGDGSGPSRPALGPAALAPARPWSPRSTGDAETPSATETSAGPAASDLGESSGQQDGEPAAQRVAGPVRPWQRRNGAPVSRPVPPPAGPQRPDSPTGLAPARPWEGRVADEPATARPATPVPSHPEVVLHALAAEADLTAAPEPASADGAASSLPDGPSPYVLDEPAVTVFVDAAAPVPDETQPTAEESVDKPRRRRRSEPATRKRPKHAALPPALGADSVAAEARMATEALEPFPAAAADADQPPAPKRPLLSRLFGRDAAEESDEPVEQFALPEPDESFERPWMRPSAPAPTKDWTRRHEPAGPALPPADAAGIAGPDERESAMVTAVIPAVASGLEPGPAAHEPEPLPEPDPEPVPVPEPEPPTPPAPTPPSAGPQDRPPVEAARRPGPGRPAAPRPRPSPGPGARPAAARRSGSHGIAGATPAAAPTSSDGISGVTGWRTSGSLELGDSPDLARVLKKIERRPELENDDAGDDEKKSPPRFGRGRRWVIRTLVVAVIAALAAMLLRSFVVQPYYIPSASMEPTLHGCPGCNDDHVLVDKISYRAHDVRAGDIVVFHRPADASYIPEKVLIKRVVALPGDVVELKNGRVYVNGLVLDEPYVNKACGPRPTNPLTSTSKWTVPGNDVFVMGDNRCRSDDSRQFGPITKSSIIGRAFAIIWPLKRIRLL